MSQTSLNSTGVASTGALSLQSNGTTEAIGISTGQVATLAQNPILTSGTANGVGYLNGSKVLTTGSALTFDGSALGVSTTANNALQLNCVSSVTGTRLTFSRNGTATAYFGDALSITGSNLDATALITAGTNPLIFGIGSEQMRLTSTGLGIGTSAPTDQVTLYGGKLRIANSTTGTSSGLVAGMNSNDAYISNQANGYLLFGTNNTERARIDSSGNLLVGTTTANGIFCIGAFSATGASQGLAVSDNGRYLRTSTNSSSAVQHYAFFNTNGQVGNIQTSGSSTAYVTSSDYRLKNTVEPMVGALAKVAALKPVTYKWNSDGSDGEGFIAHELAEVCPNAVAGEKDAIDVDGNPVYQGIDTSFLVATLTAAIQELKAEFDAYKATHP